MSQYGFFNMLGDMIFNGNKVSDKFKDKPSNDSGHEGGGGPGFDDSSSSSSSGEFNPSSEAGDAFRSVFGSD